MDKNFNILGRGGGQVVSVLALRRFCVRIPLKPTVFSVILCLKRTKINKKKEAGIGPLFKKTLLLQSCKLKICLKLKHKVIKKLCLRCLMAFAKEAIE